MLEVKSCYAPSQFGWLLYFREVVVTTDDFVAVGCREGREWLISFVASLTWPLCALLLSNEGLIVVVAPDN